MTCAVLTIGTELTRGELRDQNGGYLAEQLTERGYEVTELTSVDDHDDRIVDVLHRLAPSHDFVVCTGGLGPTTDDRTSACAARALGVQLVRNEGAHQLLVSALTSRGRAITPSSEKQADFPQGARVLPNLRGTAPGFSVELSGCRFFFMPGVPTEMEEMFRAEVVPALPVPEAPTACLRLRTFGLPEVQVNDHLQGIEDEHQVLLGYRASNSEIEVKVLATAANGEAAERLTARALCAATEIKARLGDIVYAEGTQSMAGALGGLLRARGMTLCVAESCTGGLVSELLTVEPGASDFYLGGICSYANSVKTQILGVSPAALEQHGAVSEVVARQMAEGARRSLGADLALALTGIAGPSGDTPEKPVGLVHYAVASHQGTLAFSQIFHGTRTQIQRRAALSGLWQVRAAVLASGSVSSAKLTAQPFRPPLEPD